MCSRRKGRELALQFMYGFELNQYELPQMLDNFWSLNSGKKDARWFAEKLINGTLEHMEDIDGLIVQHTLNWNLDRIAIIDRNILRLTAYELLYCDDIPPVVSINEAVDIAKKYSTPESGGFVNGVLDKLRKVLENEDQTNPAEGEASSGVEE